MVDKIVNRTLISVLGAFQIVIESFAGQPKTMTVKASFKTIRQMFEVVVVGFYIVCNFMAYVCVCLC